MEPILCDGVDVFDPLKDKLDILIEYFVKFYGEEDREFITKTLKEDTTYFFLPKSGDETYGTLTNMYSYYEKKVDEVFCELDDFFGVNLARGLTPRTRPNKIQSIKKKIIDGQELELYEAIFINNFAKEFGIPLKQKLFRANVYTDKTVLRLVKKIDEYCSVYADKFGAKVAQIRAEEQKVAHALKSNMVDVSLLEETIELNIQEKAKNCFINLLKSKNIVYNEDTCKCHLQTYIDIVKLGKLLPFVTDKQEKEIISLFKFLGIDYGENYNDYYLNFGSERNKIIDKNLTAFILKQYKDLHDKKHKQNIFLKNAEERVKMLDAKYPCDIQDATNLFFDYVYNNPTMGAYIYGYLDGNNQLKHICVFSDYFSLTNCCIIHELNHVLEDMLIGEDEGFYYTKTGFDITPHAKHENANLDLSSFIRDEHRSYESLSEIVNEFITSKINKNMVKDGVKIGGNTEKAAYYRLGFCPFYKFLEENLQVLIKSRRSPDQYALVNYIGVEEYEELANIAEEILHADFFDIKEATTEILEKCQRTDFSVVARMIREKKVLNRHKWSDDAKLLFSYIKKIDQISDKLKQNSNQTLLNASAKIKKVADVGMEK